MKKTHIIIGTSAAGIGAANVLRRLAPEDRIVCMSAESEPPYNKCFLADYAHGQKGRDQILTLRCQMAKDKNIELMLGVRVENIDRERKAVALSDGRELLYDTLLVATGASPFVPPVKGIDGPGVFTFHTLQDVDRILAFVKNNRTTNVVVIGAGLSGLEAADALVSHNCRVMVVERAPRVLHQQVDKASAQFIQNKMEKLGITFLPEAHVSEIVRSGDGIKSILLKNGKQVVASLVVCAAGVVPNGTLAGDAGIECINGGIKVDECMRTNDPSIFAAGDCVVVPDAITGQIINSCTWPDAMQQGMVAAHAMVGKQKVYGGAMPIVSSSFFGVKFASCGFLNELPDGYRIEQKSGEGYQHTFILRDSILRGFCLVGNTQQFSMLRRLVLTRQSFETYGL